MKYAYIRVSTKEQHLDRQYEAVKAYAPDLADENIYADKQSGKNFDRDAYIALKSVLVPGDEVIVKELDRLGRNKDGIKDELKWFRDHCITIRVLDIPTTLIEYPSGQEWVMDMVNNVLIEVIAAIAEQEREKIKKRQTEGIACAKQKGVQFGRPAKNVDCILHDGENVTQACKRLGVSRSYWYAHSSGTS